jgi:beta-lactamase superfamily II metal-dependent hydrolase
LKKIGGKMMFTATMTQWGVGHGGFHTGQVSGDSGVMLSYIYDCGSTARKSRLIPQVKRYVQELRRRKATHIDALYISHFDWDHVNGLQALSENLDTIKLERIYAPFLTTADKLVLLARWEKKEDAFYGDLILDSEASLQRLFPSALVSILGTDEGPRPPGETLAGDPDSDDNTLGGTVFSSAGVAVVRSSSQGASQPQEVWELVPIVQPGVRDREDAFWNALKALPGSKINRKDVAVDLSAAIKAHRAKFRAAAIETLGRDGSNASSMLLYSGPLLRAPRVHWGSARITRPSPRRVMHVAASGWLSTGDARLEDSVAVDEVKRRLGAKRCNEVAVVAAPHHGSVHNSGRDLWRAFPTAAIVTVHATGTKHHPHERVTQTIIDQNLVPVLAKGRYVQAQTRWSR